jgi:hypothetical protein
VAWVGHDDHTGAVMVLRGAEGVSLFVGRVGVSFVTTESLSERDDIETGQVKARHTGSVFEQRKRLQDRIRAVPHPLRGMPAGVGRQFRIDDALDPAAAAQGGRESARDSPDAKAWTRAELLHRRGSRLQREAGR